MSAQIRGFVAAEKTSRIVGRQTEIESIKRAIYRPDDSLQIVFARGPIEAENRHEPEGGYGKTRLLQEVTEQTQKGGAWASLGNPTVSDLIDLFDIRLHARTHFLRAVRDSFVGRAEFLSYDEAFDRYQRLRGKGGEYRYLVAVAEEAVEAFLADYQANAARQRMVWLVDTVEQLAIVSSDWLLDRQLLTTGDLHSATLTWLVDHIRAGSLRNTTLLLAGRGYEGKRFFDEIRAAAEASANTEVVKVRAEPFTADETRRYFEVLAGEWARRAETAKNRSGSEAASYNRVSKILADLPKQPELNKVFWLHTGGVPVRLALFAQVLVEDRTIPIPLKLPWEKAIQELKTDDPHNVTPELELAQWRIEDRLIFLFFASNDLRARILQTLVRTRRGLTAEQLHFVLDSAEQVTPQEWEKAADRKRVREINAELRNMENLFLVKHRPTGWSVLNQSDGPTSGAERIGLQDEIYRIYAEHMAPQAEPMDERVNRIWERLPDEDHKRYTQNRQDEQRARSVLYRRLRDWAKYELDKVRQQQRAYQDEDERVVSLSNPTEPRTMGFQNLGDAERAHRTTVLTAIRELQMEYMYYELLLDPERGLNTVYMDIADAFWAAHEEEADLLTQAEMWRALYDAYALKFVDFVPRLPVRKRNEKPIDVLRRAARQEDAARWIKRLVLRNDYARTQEFADDVERAIGQLVQGSEQDRKDATSWNHTLARSERLCWRNYAQILMAQEVRKAIGSLKDVAESLEKLARHTIEETAISASEATSGQDEPGFLGVDESIPERRTHPAYVRLKRVMSFTYNVMGYGYVSLGHYRQGVQCYGKALYHIREPGANAQRATVLNNLARALSEMGRYGAIRVCQDGLELHKQLGEDVTIALSHNTLALIYNDMYRPAEAWPEAAIAVAYFRRAEEKRGLGLALLQFGEALRRMANRARLSRVLTTEPDRLYSAAEELVKEAHGLFSPPESKSAGPSLQGSGEPVRLIEAKIELGCLFRDRIQAGDEGARSPQWRIRYREALSYLEGATRAADSRGLERLALDARVDLAWTHFLVEEFDEAEMVLQAAEDMLKGKDCFIQPRSLEMPDGFIPNPLDQAEFYVFPQLSRIYGLRGLIAFQRFRDLASTIDREFPEDSPEYTRLRHEKALADEHAQRSLDQAAEAYTLGIAYAQLHSARSSALNALYDQLYRILKKFNGIKLDAFRERVEIQRQRYPIEQIRQKIDNLGDLREFLTESFGFLDEGV